VSRCVACPTRAASAPVSAARAHSRTNPHTHPHTHTLFHTVPLLPRAARVGARLGDHEGLVVPFRLQRVRRADHHPRRCRLCDLDLIDGMVSRDTAPRRRAQRMCVCACVRAHPVHRPAVAVEEHAHAVLQEGPRLLRDTRHETRRRRVTPARAVPPSPPARAAARTPSVRLSCHRSRMSGRARWFPYPVAMWSSE
jgi:hypothetical protein